MRVSLTKHGVDTRMFHGGVATTFTHELIVWASAAIWCWMKLYTILHFVQILRIVGKLGKITSRSGRKIESSVQFDHSVLYYELGLDFDGQARLERVMANTMIARPVHTIEAQLLRILTKVKRIEHAFIPLSHVTFGNILASVVILCAPS